MLTTLFYSLLTLDQTVLHFSSQYGTWVYALLFAIIFAETGLVVFPFLPATPSCSSPAPSLPPPGSRPPADLAADRRRDLRRFAQLRDRQLHRPEGLRSPGFPLVRQQHLRRTQAFYDKYGG